MTSMSMEELLCELLCLASLCAGVQVTGIQPIPLSAVSSTNLIKLISGLTERSIEL